MYDYENYGLTSITVLSQNAGTFESQYVTVEEANEHYNNMSYARVCKAGKVVVTGKEE